MSQPLQSALQQAIRSALGCANDFNGDLHAMCDVYGIPAAPISGRLIPAANRFDASITDASSALNYFLQNPQNACGTLALDFTRTSTLDPRITFSRGSQATLFDSTGALVYAKHNLLLQSQTFDAAYWAKNNGATVTADAGAAPDGTTTADQFNGAALTSTGVFTFPTGIQSNVAYTFSVYIKNVSAATTLSIGCDTNPSNAKVTFNAATGAITAAGANVTSSAVIDMGNGWYRVIVRFTTTSTAPGFVIYSDSGALATWLTWGAQLNLTAMEGGVTSSLSTYYPTVASAYYAPRFDYNPSTLAAQGLLIEEQRTNSIRNNTMQGAVAGTPGTAPTNWVTTLRGLTQTIVGTGTSNGIAYVDIRFNGTTTSLGGIEIKPDGNAGVIAATASQAWAMSSWVAIVGGSTANTTGQRLILNEYSAGPTYLRTAVAATNILASGSTLARVSGAVTTGASTTIVEPIIILDAASGVAIDITLRIGLPQLEQGAFATSVIPTTTTALTRNADVASMTGTNFSSWYNQTEGTFVVIGSCGNFSSSPIFVMPHDGTSNNYLNAPLMTTLGNARSAGVVGGVAWANVSTANSISVNVTGKIAAAYKASDQAITLNAGTVATGTNASVPTVTTLQIGNWRTGVGNSINGYIQRISYYPVRLPNSTLQALTA